DRLKNNSWVYQLYRKEGDPLHQMYSNVVNNGIIDLEEGRTYDIKIEVREYAGNKKEVKYKITGKTPPAEKPISSDAIIFQWDQENHFKREGIELMLPKGIIYEDFEFKY